MAEMGGALKTSVLVKRCRYKGQLLHDCTRVRSQSSQIRGQKVDGGAGAGVWTECFMGQCPLGR